MAQAAGIMPGMVTVMASAGPWSANVRDCDQLVADAIQTGSIEHHEKCFEALRVQWLPPSWWRQAVAALVASVALAATTLQLLPCAVSVVACLLFPQDWRSGLLLQLLGFAAVCAFRPPLDAGPWVQAVLLSAISMGSQLMARRESWSLFETLVKTERKRWLLLQQCSTVFQAVSMRSDGLFFTDAEGVIKRHNRCLETVFSLSKDGSPSPLLGQSIVDWCSTEEDRKTLLAFLQKCCCTEHAQQLKIKLRVALNDGDGELVLSNVLLGGLRAPPIAHPAGGIIWTGACLALNVVRHDEENLWDFAQAVVETHPNKHADAPGGPAAEQQLEGAEDVHRSISMRPPLATLPEDQEEDIFNQGISGARSYVSAPPVLMQPNLLEFVRHAAVADCDEEGDSLPPDGTVWVEGAPSPTTLEQIKVGQRVLCFDRLSRGMKYTEVTGVKISDAKESNWVRVVLEDDTEMLMSADHPVFPEVAGEKDADLGVVLAGALEVGKHSLEVLKMVPVRVREVGSVSDVATLGSSIQSKRAPEKRVTLSVQQADRHSIFFARAEGMSMAAGSASISVDKLGGRYQDSFAIKNTFLELLAEQAGGDLEEDLQQFPRRRRRLNSAPADLCVLEESEEDDFEAKSVAYSVGETAVGSDRVRLNRRRPTQPHMGRTTTGNSSRFSAATGMTWQSSRASSAASSVPRQIVVGNKPKDRDFVAGMADAEERQNMAELSAALAARRAGLRSIGSLNHPEGKCYPCLMQTWLLTGKSNVPCKFGMFCGRCHEPHSETDVRRMRKNVKQRRH